MMMHGHTQIKFPTQLFAVLQVDNLENPPYGPGLAPSDFYLFPVLKNYLSGHKFADDDDTTTAVTCVKIAGHRILRAGRNEQIGQGPQS
jgi:hypothetical protein